MKARYKLKKQYPFFPMIVFLLAGLLFVSCAPQTTTVEPAPAASEQESAAAEAPAASGQRISLATTTSTQDSGLLDAILPDFTAETGISVDVIAVGTGQALQLGVDGNADVLLVHARAREDAFMDAGDGVRRVDVMYNDFVIIGPAADPAGIRGQNKVATAFEILSQSGELFVSRGDDSGTHTKEKGLWAEAGIEPTGDWYISAGQGMGAVLIMADELQAYSLTDRATYLAMKDNLALEILAEGDALLFNPYGVIAVNPDKNPEIKNDLANQFIDWLVSLPTQEKIATFGLEQFGQPLFTPDSQAWRAEHGTATGDSE